MSLQNLFKHLNISPVFYYTLLFKSIYLQINLQQVLETEQIELYLNICISTLAIS